MDWLLLGALGIIWAALLVPGRKGRGRSLQGDFSVFTKPGRTVLMPRPGERFLGAPHRTRARVRERRRRVFTVLVEGVALTGLIGLFPPLRRMWAVTGILAVLLIGYVWMLLQLRAQEMARRGQAAPAPPQAPLFTQPSFPVVEEGGRRIIVVPNPDRPPSRVAG